MVMLGMFALNPVGITGSIVQQLNHGISTGALFLLVGVVYERRHTREISEYGGLSKVMPVYAAIFLIMTMSSIGLPTLNGFIGELLILQGVFVANKIWAAFAGERRRARRRLHAVPVSADDVRQGRESEERAAARSEPSRIRDVRAAADSRGLDGALSEAVPATGINTSVQHIVARVNPDYPERNASAADCGSGAPVAAAVVAANAGAKFLASTPCDANGKPLSSRHRRRHSEAGVALMPAGMSVHDFYNILPELVLTGGALLVLVADVLLGRTRRHARSRRLRSLVHRRHRSRRSCRFATSTPSSPTVSSPSIGSRCSSRSSF